MAVLTTSYQLIASKYIGDASSSTTKNVYLRIYAKYTSQDIAGNKSYVSYKSTLYVDGGGTYFYTGNYTTKSLSGTGATATSGDAQGNYYIGETTLCEITGTVAHSTSGDASVSITAGWVSTPWGINGSLSGTATLPTIARATTPTLSATSVTMGNTITISLAPANSTFKHKVRYDFGNTKGSAEGISIGYDFSAQGNTNVTFTPPTYLGDEIPNANSGTCKIICYTYLSNGTHIGTIEKNITLSVPSYTPEINNVTLTGNNLLSGAYVRGKSTITGNATLKTYYGAKIKSVIATVDEKSYSSLPFTSSALSNGSKTVTITFTDSRDKSVTYTSFPFTVYDYSPPQITEFTLERQSDGTTVIATVKGSISAINNKNTKTIKVTLNGVTNTITSSAYTINATTTFTNVNTDTTFTATATFTDYYGTISKDSVLPTVAVTMDFYKDGNGIAMGKVAEKGNLLDVAWDIRNDSVPTLLGGMGKPIPSGANINTIDYITPGNYVCALNDTAKTLVNSPTSYAFNMQVSNCLDTWKNVQTGSYMYLVRKITNLDGNAWVQYVRKEGGDWYYAPWRMVIDTGSCRDWVIEQGPWDGWDYVRWNSGKLELFGEKSLSFPEGAKQADYLYRSIVSLDLSNWFTKIMSGTCSVQVNGMVPQVCRHSTNLATAEIVIVTSRTIPSFTITAPIYIIGKWK